MKIPIGLAAALVTVGALSACATAAPTATSTASDTSTPSATPAATGGLSFSAGNDLSTELTGAPTFLNGFVSPTSGWTATDASDTKNGRYVYSSADGLCTATLLQVKADGKSFEVVADDDRTSSSNALTWYFSDTPEVATEVATAATDATLPFGIGWEPGEPGTDFRGVSAQTEKGGAFATYARVFGKPGVALFAEIACTTADGFAQHAQNALLDSGVLVQ